MTKEELYREAWERWGAESQLEQLQEECAELITAISHFKRHRPGYVNEFCEELADVEILVEQVEQMLPAFNIIKESVKQAKLARLEKRLQDEDEEEVVLLQGEKPQGDD